MFPINRLSFDAVSNRGTTRSVWILGLLDLLPEDFFGFIGTPPARD
jgi:hypothetical protein